MHLVLAFLSLLPSLGFAASVRECATSLEAEGAPIESLAHVPEYTQEQLKEAAIAVREMFSIKVPLESHALHLQNLSERLAVAEQNFLHRGRENNPQAVRALGQFASGEIFRSDSTLAKLQKVIDESVEWSRSLGVLRRLELDEQAWLSGDHFVGRLDVYGPAPLSILRRFSSELKNRMGGQRLQFVRAESFARELLRLPPGQRLTQLRKAMRAAAPALGWNEVAVLLGAFASQHRLAALEVLKPRVFTPITFFTNQTKKSLEELVPGLFEPESWFRNRTNRRVVALGAALAVGFAGISTSDRFTLGMRKLSDGTTVLQKKNWLLSFKSNEKRAEAFTHGISVQNLQEMTVSEVIGLADAFDPKRYWDDVGRGLHDKVLTLYVGVHPELGGEDLRKLADAAITDEAHDAILQPKSGLK